MPVKWLFLVCKSCWYSNNAYYFSLILWMEFGYNMLPSCSCCVGFVVVMLALGFYLPRINSSYLWNRYWHSMISNLCCGLFLPCNQKNFSKSLLTAHHLSLEAGPFFTYWKHLVFITHVTTFFHFVILVWNWSQGSTSSRTSICSCFFASTTLKTSTCFQLIDKVF